MGGHRTFGSSVRLRPKRLSERPPPFPHHLRRQLAKPLSHVPVPDQIWPACPTSPTFGGNLTRGEGTRPGTFRTGRPAATSSPTSDTWASDKSRAGPSRTFWRPKQNVGSNKREWKRESDYGKGRVVTHPGFLCPFLCL